MEFNSALMFLSIELNAVFVLVIILILVVHVRKKRHTIKALKCLVDSVVANRRKRRQQIENDFNECLGEEGSWITDTADSIVRSEILLHRNIVDSFFTGDVKKINEIGEKVTDFASLYEEFISTVSNKFRNDLLETVNEQTQTSNVNDIENKQSSKINAIEGLDSSDIDALAHTGTNTGGQSDQILEQESISSEKANIDKDLKEDPIVVSTNGLDELPSELLEMDSSESNLEEKKVIKESRSFDLSDNNQNTLGLEGLLGSRDEQGSTLIDEVTNENSVAEPQIDDMLQTEQSHQKTTRDDENALLEELQSPDDENVENEIDDDRTIDELLDFDAILSDVELQKSKE